MFDIGAAELLVIIIVAVLVIGPKDMPHAMRTAGRWIGKVRKVSSHFRTGIDAMVREAELEDMEKKWKEQNEAIMKRSAASAEAASGEPVMTGPPPKPEAPKSVSAESAAPKAASDAVEDVQPEPAPGATESKD
ncbi:Sec-independent protein secretion pathway component [Erythrobacter sp. NAP1]|uniref:Sec-independent protein translocase protein TatB n=1 Tax=Erythrobacter sp. NAP1 TaxID=237727 RepID=UPI0000686BE6|nr:Sec-independent protein translocase protein TatB [Erythrobacter sp. NAP1]EAQ29256.1 Sec-independent protein secretion pathway component [Erythrobacter sp. NAP1]